MANQYLPHYTPTPMSTPPQQAQNATLIGALRPCPIPAYLACSPYSSISTNTGCSNCYSA